MEAMETTDVVIAGGGPAGLMLACELRLAGAGVVVLERLAERSGESRAGGVHPRTVEVLDQRGILGRFLAVARRMQAGHFSGLPLDFSGFETRHPYTLVILQHVVERLLEERALELGARVHRPAEVTGFHQDQDGVGVEVRGRDGEERLRAAYLVGCDGGRSTVRKLAGIGFPGTDATMSAMLADVELADPPAGPIFQRRAGHGDFSVIGFGQQWYRVMVNQFDRVAGRDAPLTFEEVREAFTAIAGTDYGMHSPRWVSRFGDAARQADRYRHGRVLLAGDAAHIHYPAGGQGLNTSVQDAVNLGWKLASVVRGHAPEELLDTYHAERYPVGERVLHNTRAQTALNRPGAHMDALREVFRGLMGTDEVNRSLGGMISALDIRYPMGAAGEGHPLVGLRVPDVDLADGSRLYGLLHAARPVLLDLAGLGLAPVAGGWADRVDHVGARCKEDRWPVPVVGEVPAPAALLIRPDGHVAWVAPAGAEADTDGLRTALTSWFGPAR